jgi:hypothetical protein
MICDADERTTSSGIPLQPVYGREDCPHGSQHVLLSSLDVRL